MNYYKAKAIKSNRKPIFIMSNFTDNNDGTANIIDVNGDTFTIETATIKGCDNPNPSYEFWQTSINTVSVKKDDVPNHCVITFKYNVNSTLVLKQCSCIQFDKQYDCKHIKLLMESEFGQYMQRLNESELVRIKEQSKLDPRVIRRTLADDVQDIITERHYQEFLAEMAASTAKQQQQNTDVCFDVPF